MQEQKEKIDAIKKEVDNALSRIDLDSLRHKVSDLTKKSQNPDFWNDQNEAQKVSKELSDITKEIEEWEKISGEVEELVGLLPSIDIENDPSGAEDFKKMVTQLENDWRKLEIKTFLNGKFDKNNAILSIHAGTGGKDAMDFAEMLLRMYIRYLEQNGFKVEIAEKSDGEEVGIKSVTVFVEGLFAYGYLKGEQGVHRLVRLSPFNAKNSRETSFVLVDILPEVNEEHIEKIDKADLKIDTFRASGAGGQHVNTTDSAVRITHIPTGIVAACQDERSQIQNKERAMKILAGKLHEMAEREHVEELNEIRGEHKEMSWGNQIRSYVLQPYTMVKDHRSNYEEHDVNKVLDGAIDGFIEAELKSQI
ncbi:peptide chain release factor 2 [Candidatus Peregrinibacteria bacterium]|nr:peptide chain release factor 2 [Candidatus Peregrinibacteria bacterium]